jgi:hypothetical protein
MKMRMIVALMAALAVTGLSARAFESGHRLGVGVNYWTALDDVDVHDIDENGFGYVFSYQYRGELLGIGIDHEILPDRFGEDSYAPQVYLLLGRTVYAGAGIGCVYADGDWADEPFFSFRAGLDLEVLPSVHLDVYGQYRFESKQDLKDETKDIDTDTVFLGAALRLVL